MHINHMSSNNALFFQLFSSDILSGRLFPKHSTIVLLCFLLNGIFFAGILLKRFKSRTILLLDNAGKRKGKLVEKQGRKTTGLKLKSQDSRVAENE